MALALLPTGTGSVSRQGERYDRAAIGDNYEENIGRRFIVLLCWALVLLLCPFSLVFCLKVIKEYERAVVFRLGRVKRKDASGPGLIFVMPCIDNYQKVDLRLITYNVPPQEILSKDSVTVTVDAVVYFRMNNALASVVNVTNADYSTQLLTQSMLRNILGTKTLTEILCDRATVAHQMQSTLDEATEHWGVQVERVEVKNVRLPEQLQRAMAAEAEATRNAKAEVIAAEGEQKASHGLKEAANVISKSACALQLRYLQTLNTISAEKRSTILFPVPVNIMSLFGKKPINSSKGNGSSTLLKKQPSTTVRTTPATSPTTSVQATVVQLESTT